MSFHRGPYWVSGKDPFWNFYMEPNRAFKTSPSKVIDMCFSRNFIKSISRVSITVSLGVSYDALGISQGSVQGIVQKLLQSLSYTNVCKLQLNWALSFSQFLSSSIYIFFCKHWTSRKALLESLEHWMTLVLNKTRLNFCTAKAPSRVGIELSAFFFTGNERVTNKIPRACHEIQHFI